VREQAAQAGIADKVADLADKVVKGVTESVAKPA
jgi:hypothetical protein